MVQTALNIAGLSWLTGPIFDKELRVSSRRRRNYVLRFAYVGLLLIFLVLIWLEEVHYGQSSLVAVSRMSRAAQNIVAFIVWFQFCATQLVAITMLSTAISDEIYHRTLGSLMTTPINSIQIVIGKLLSKLLQIILLLGLSLPLLAIVRVLGGVPWDFVVASLALTLAAVLFVGSLSLFFSIFTRRAYVAIIATVLTLGVVFALIPALAAYLVYRHVSERVFLSVLQHVNPYITLALLTDALMSPASVTRIATSCRICCPALLAAAAIVLCASIVLVRKVALLQATGQLGKSARARKRPNGPSEAEQYPRSITIRRVAGPAVLWKELTLPVFGRHKTLFLVLTTAAILTLLVSYAIFQAEGDLDQEEVHMFYTAALMGLGTLFTIVLPATCVTSEKESGTLPLLLLTTLSDTEIVLGKFVGAIRRSLPAWLFLCGHLVLFCAIGMIHPIAIVQIGIIVTSVVVFLSCTGLYFSSRFKHTTTAVIMNFTLAAVIWAGLPLLLFVLCDITRASDDLASAYLNANPFFQALLVMNSAANGWDNLRCYYWCEFSTGPVASTILMLCCLGIYSFVGLLFAVRATYRLRQTLH